MIINETNHMMSINETTTTMTINETNHSMTAGDTDHSMIPNHKDRILWRRCEEGVCILQVFSNRTDLVLPSHIEGLPVTEIGPYCFSARLPKLPDDYGDTLPEAAHLPAASGNFIEKITLPAPLKTLHNAVFYNCRKLNTLAMGTELSAIGSDVFTNCTNLRHLIVDGSADEPSGIGLILERLEGGLSVSFSSAKLSFPEYYEWLDEVTPAHLFSRSIHGEGFRMRKCIKNRCIDFGKYDQCFPHVLQQESDSVVLKIALNRLRYPVHLSGEARALYEQALKERLAGCAAGMIRERDRDGLHFLSGYLTNDPEAFETTLTACREADWAEGTVLLLEGQRTMPHRTIQKLYDF